MKGGGKTSRTFKCPSCGAEIQQSRARARDVFPCGHCGAVIRAKARLNWLRWTGILMAIVVARFSPVEDVLELFALCLLLVAVFAFALPFVAGLFFKPRLELQSIASATPSIKTPRAG